VAATPQIKRLLDVLEILINNDDGHRCEGEEDEGGEASFGFGRQNG
jgi:hypothetical protein